MKQFIVSVVRMYVKTSSITNPAVDTVFLRKFFPNISNSTVQGIPTSTSSKPSTISISPTENGSNPGIKEIGFEKIGKIFSV